MSQVDQISGSSPVPSPSRPVPNPCFPSPPPSADPPPPHPCPPPPHVNLELILLFAGEVPLPFLQMHCAMCEIIKAAGGVAALLSCKLLQCFGACVH